MKPSSRQSRRENALDRVRADRPQLGAFLDRLAAQVHVDLRRSSDRRLPGLDSGPCRRESLYVSATGSNRARSPSSARRQHRPRGGDRQFRAVLARPPCARAGRRASATSSRQSARRRSRHARRPRFLAGPKAYTPTSSDRAARRHQRATMSAPAGAVHACVFLGALSSSSAVNPSPARSSHVSPRDVFTHTFQLGELFRGEKISTISASFRHGE
jgi:predicted component of type VI protein secretion system